MTVERKVGPAGWSGVSQAPFQGEGWRGSGHLVLDLGNKGS